MTTYRQATSLNEVFFVLSNASAGVTSFAATPAPRAAASDEQNVVRFRHKSFRPQ